MNKRSQFETVVFVSYAKNRPHGKSLMVAANSDFLSRGFAKSSVDCGPFLVQALCPSCCDLTIEDGWHFLSLKIRSDIEAHQNLQLTWQSLAGLAKVLWRHPSFFVN